VYTAGNLVMIKKQFDLKPSPSGVITGSVVPNDKILCGGVASTLWTITPMKDALTPIQPAQQYDILSSGGTFNLATAMPTNPALAPPGFVVLFGNPTQSQTITQPAGTSLTFLGTFDFTNATVLGLATSGGGTGPFSPGTVACVPYYTGTANSCDTHATLDGFGNFVATGSVSAPLFLSSGVGGVIQFPAQTAPTSFNGNPLVAGNCYVFYNSGTSLFDGVLAGGAHCIGSGGASGVAGGSLGGSYPNPTVLKLNFGATTIPLSGTAPISGQFLKYDGTSVVGAAGGGGGSTVPPCSVSGLSDVLSQAAGTLPGTFATTCPLSNTGLIAGSILEIRVHGVFTTTPTANPLENIQINAGGTTGICKHPTASNPGQGLTNIPWSLVCYIQIVSTGTPGTAVAWGEESLAAGPGGLEGANSPHAFVNTGTVSFITTSSQTVSIQETATPVAGQSFTLQSILVRNY
jgi:hypothetical protein